MDLDPIRAKSLAAIAPLKAADAATAAPNGMLFSAKETEAGRKLPPYWLVYFLLVDLLVFKNLGRFEKLAWSVPVDLGGRAYLIEHRKFGLGVFGADTPDLEVEAAKVVRLIQRGVKAAEPYFNWRAAQAVAASELNVENRAGALFQRFTFLAQEYEARRVEAEARAKEVVRTEVGKNSWTIEMPADKIRREAGWLAMSAIESFFSWTEHVFILIAILQGDKVTGQEITDLAMADWKVKFRAALDITDPASKRFYDELGAVRTQARNFVAHGAFGKEFEAFRFHSNAGAVPVRVVPAARAALFRISDGGAFVDETTITLLHGFIQHLWAGPRIPARIYIQDWSLPLILTMTANGDYAGAMATEAGMEKFAEALARRMDNSLNMDW